MTVHFELVAAHTEQNNVKGEKRFFILRVEDADYDEENRTLTIPFEYRPLNGQEEAAYDTRNQQEKIIAEAVEIVTARFQKNADALATLVGERRRNAKGEPVSLLSGPL